MDVLDASAQASAQARRLVLTAMPQDELVRLVIGEMAGAFSAIRNIAYSEAHLPSPAPQLALKFAGQLADAVHNFPSFIVQSAADREVWRPRVVEDLLEVRDIRGRMGLLS